MAAAPSSSPSSSSSSCCCSITSPSFRCDGAEGLKTGNYTYTSWNAPGPSLLLFFACKEVIAIEKIKEFVK